MKRLLSIIMEYICEVFMIIAFCFSIISDCIVQGGITIISIIISGIGAIIIYIVFWSGAYLLSVMLKPSKCKLLHISGKNEIHMNTIYMNTEKRKRLFYKEFEAIIEFARKNNRSPLKINTHEIVLLGMLCKYVNMKRKEAYEICNNMQIGEVIECKSCYGTMKIKRNPNGINTCARFEYKRIMKPFQLKKTISDVKLYEIEIILDRDRKMQS